jgi:hypothetical protein
MADEEYYEKGRYRKKSASGGMSAGFYGMVFVGVCIYYIQHASGFWDGLLGIVKAIFWPGFLAYRLFEFLGV